MLAQLDLNGNPYIGVFCAVNENFGFVPRITSKKEIKEIERVLEVKIIKTSIDGSSVIGSLMAINSNGALIPDFINTKEFMILKKEINIKQISDNLNATGNNILVNDKAALVHPDFTKATLKIIQDIFNVEVLKGTVAGLNTVGSAAIATNKGILCHPKIKENEFDIIKNLFNIDVSIGTVNYGTAMIGAGLVGNSKGAITGTNTTGIELNRIEDALNLLY